MASEKLFDYDQFVASNSDSKKSIIDYLGLISTLSNLPADFFISFTKLFLPDFFVCDNRVYVKNLFDQSYFESLKANGHAPEKVQFWLNLLEITGLFPVLSSEQAIAFGEALVQTWNMKISTEFGAGKGVARVIYDESLGEVFVVVD